jgi:hypothetical protein
MQRRTVATWATLGTAGAVVLVASRPGSPFTPPLFPGAGPLPPLAEVASWVGLDRLSRDVVAVVGAAVLFAAVGAFLYALRQAWAGALTVRRVIAVAVVLHASAVVIPVFLSRDVYSYAIYGRMVSEYGANPYVAIPAEFTSDPVYPLVSVDWLDSTSVYGPASNVIFAGVTSAASSPAATVLGFKLVAALASLAAMLLVLGAARRALPERAAFAALLVGWNPVVVFHGVAGGHNDAVLGLAVAAGALAILARRELWATAALTAGTLVKASAGVPLLVAVVAAVVRRPPGQRLRAAGVHAAVVLAVALPFIIPFFQTEDPTLGMGELATRQGWLAPSRFVLVIFRGLAGAVGGDVAREGASLVVRLAFPLAFLWLLWRILRHLGRAPARLDPVLVVGAVGWASLLSLLASPVLLPWYVIWVIPVVWLLPRTARGGAVLVSVALAITELVAEPSRAPRVWEAMVFGLHWVATPIMLIVLVRLVIDLRRRLASSTGLGFLDPLMIEELDAPDAIRRSTPPQGALAPVGAEGGHVAQPPEDHHDGQPPKVAGGETESVEPDGAEHRHGDPR